MNRYMEQNALPNGMPKQEREALLIELRELLRLAKMESCNFDPITPEEVVTNFIDGKENSTTITDYVKEKTRLWRETWMIYPLEQLIERYETGCKIGRD